MNLVIFLWSNLIWVSFIESQNMLGVIKESSKRENTKKEGRFKELIEISYGTKMFSPRF